MIRDLWPLLLFFTVQAEAMPRLCVDYLAAQAPTFQAGRAMQVFKGIEEPCASVLFNTFGNSRRFIAKMAGRGGHIHWKISNQSCVRLNRCEPGDAVRTPRLLKKRAEKVRKLCERYGLSCSGAPGLEDGWTNAEAREMTCAMKEVWPYEILRNPLGRDAGRYRTDCADGIELHDPLSDFSAARRCHFSNDGFDLAIAGPRWPLPVAFDLSGVRALARTNLQRGCSISIWWNNQGVAAAGFIRPSRRSIRIFYTDIRAVNRLLLELKNE